MVVDIEQIREDELKLFRKGVKKFYKQRENQYFQDLKEKIKTGEIDPDSSDYKEICLKEAKTFMSTRGKALLKFTKDYVDQRSNEILDAVAEKKLIKGKAGLQLEVLKYILLAGEEDALK